MILVRLLLQTVLLALGQIWANKFRALLTALGIIIAVFAVITVVGAMNGFKVFLLDQFATFGANKVWVFPRMPPGQRDRYSWRQIRMTIDQIDALLPNSPSLDKVSPILNLNADIQAGDRFLPAATIQGVRPEWHDIEQRFVTVGRPLSKTDEEQRRQVCLVNDKGVQELALPEDPTGTYVLLQKRRFLIIGVVETRQVAPMFGGDEAQTEVFIPFRTGEAMREFPRMYAVATTKAPELYDDARAEITAQLRRMRGLKPGEPDTFGIEAIEQAIAQVKSVLGGITFMLAGVVSISLLIGGIGIMNIMLVSVSERTREIGLRKAVGARPEVVLLQFLVEAVTLSLVGCAIGLALGLGAVGVMKAFPDSPVSKASAPMWSILLAVGFSAGTGVVFGMFPAMKAASLNPIDALRHE
ncbi:MAG: multidrug ABC transporter substrate-binding protein [Phycisphaerae bacterium]|nr:MAG: multidrug ABC transporter substrate-binding protein [Phycisphaerae bacterium]